MIQHKGRVEYLSPPCFSSIKSPTLYLHYDIVNTVSSLTSYGQDLEIYQ